MKAIETCFALGLFIMKYTTVVSFEAVDEMPKYD